MGYRQSCGAVIQHVPETSIVVVYEFISVIISQVISYLHHRTYCDDAGQGLTGISSASIGLCR